MYQSRKNLPRCLLGLSLLLISTPVPAQSLTALATQLHWREVGPFRGGWSTMAAGVPVNPNVYYFGAADGGVWKTTDAGLTWRPLFQQQASISIGALAIAPSNPKIIYVGTGQPETRYDIVEGNGVYRSDDGGQTWVHVGLADTHHIGRIWVDPENPNVVLVAALGHIFGPNAERGVFRSADGGRHWTKVLYVDENTGAVDLAADEANPEVIFAATWQARMYPWLAYFKPQAGLGSGIWKSTDGGRTWTRLTGHGLPAGPLGRIGLAVAPGTHDRRVYAIISSPAKDASGLYRSDDGGGHWRLVGGRKLADWYFARVTVDPRDPDTLYVMNRSVARSTDGGRTFTWFKGAPGGDDYHFMWINPNDDRYMILASDQGTTISVDGGKTWSSWYNQATGQFYHVATDNRFPYRIYSGQQDSGTVETRSRSDFGEITFRDWHPVGGDERSYAVPDPADPHIVYVGGLGGHVSRFDARTGLVQDISAWPISTYGQRPDASKYRYSWFYPVVADPHQGRTLYLGAQVVFKTSDGGLHWRAISPDLSGANAKVARNCDSDTLGLQQARDCGYGVVFTIAPSPLDGNLIWAGTDDGLIWLTRDGGRHWQNVTPSGLPLWGRVNQIDASPGDPASAYAAVDAHRAGDTGVYLYRTHDYGRTWTRIVNGIPAGQYAYVVRQDPRNPRLLYAGTHAGVYVSFDDGDHWQSLQLNLPTARVRDLTLHGDDLIAATQGRALWILDDVTPLRQASPAVLAADTYLFAPATAVRAPGNNNKDTPLPPEIPAAQNPPAGAVIDYWLGRKASGPVKLAIYDSRGALVREYASNAPSEKLKAERYFARGWLGKPQRLSAAAGAHRFVWDLRYPRPHAVQYDYSIAAVYGRGTPLLPRGPAVLPGRYTVALTVDGRTYRQPLVVALDPRVQPAAGALERQLELARRMDAALDASFAVHETLGRLHGELAALARQLATRSQGGALLQTVSKLDRQVMELADRAAKGGSYAAINRGLAALASQVNDGDREPPEAYRRAFDLYAARLKAANITWQQIRRFALPALNAELRQAGIAPLAPE